MGVQKIAILGGGVGSMSTAWELTNVSGWREKYDITVYQMGWRLGGKGASGRNTEVHSRIQEHGLHMWMGFYENAFEVMREVYEYCQQKGLMPGSPFRTYKDAFSPVDVISVIETVHGDAVPWTVVFPPTDSWPGEDGGPAGVADHGTLVWYYIVRILELLVAEFDKDIAGVEGSVGWFPASWRSSAVGRLSSPLHHALDAAHGLPRDPAQQSEASRDAVAQIIEGFGALFLPVVALVGDLFTLNPELRRLVILLDTGLALVRGIIADDIIERGFSHIDSLEFSDWLKSHGCHNPKNPITCAFYDACFAYVNGSPSVNRQNMAAGTMLDGLLRLALGYNKSIMLAMNAGMGDTIFAPFYLALKDRGVKFEFFHRVTGLSLSEDRLYIDQIGMDVQATPRNSYQPLIQSKGVYCWPSEPLWDQLADAAAILGTPVNHDLESAWCACTPVKSSVLKRGVDFDVVVNGISLGALPFLSKELMDANQGWSRMLAQVLLVRTQAFQLWLNVPTANLGWNPGTPGAGILTGFVEPFDTWADMSRLIPVEDFPAGTCQSIAYFCNCLEDDGPPAPFGDPAYPGVQTARVLRNAQDFLNRDIGKIWPAAVDENGFKTQLLAAGESLDGQFFRANVEPSELYVLSTAGTIQARLAPGQSGFQNLILAGDWTRVELNIGCVEAAVQSGKMAANALCGSPEFIRGAFGIRIPIRNGALS
jgi:uncharacterized protein with NAD-binding domain and iron-sulfur cluster